MIKPVIKSIGDSLCAYCPFCGEKIYEREPEKGAQLACHNALNLHAPSCKMNPDYIETDSDKLKKKILHGLN
jgi:hypothetical protein